MGDRANQIASAELIRKVLKAAEPSDHLGFGKRVPTRYWINWVDQADALEVSITHTKLRLMGGGTVREKMLHLDITGEAGRKSGRVIRSLLEGGLGDITSRVSVPAPRDVGLFHPDSKRPAARPKVAVAVPEAIAEEDPEGVAAFFGAVLSLVRREISEDVHPKDAAGNKHRTFGGELKAKQMRELVHGATIDDLELAQDLLDHVLRAVRNPDAYELDMKIGGLPVVNWLLLTEALPEGAHAELLRRVLMRDIDL